MAELELIDHSFERSKSNQYHLSIQVDPDGICFSVLDPGNEKYVLLRKYRYSRIRSAEMQLERLEQIMKEDEFLRLSYSGVSVLYLTQKSTLIPHSFFDESKIRNYFEFNHVLEDLDEIHYNYIAEIDAYTIFAIPNYLANIIYNAHRNSKYYHQATPFIKSVISGLSEPSGVHINLNSHFFDIVVKDQSMLSLYNTFHYQNDTDLLYFVLYVLKQLKVELSATFTTLSGEHCDKPVYYDALKEYLPNIVYLEPVYPGFSDAFGKINTHRFFNLFYLYNCE